MILNIFLLAMLSSFVLESIAHAVSAFGKKQYTLILRLSKNYLFLVLGFERLPFGQKLLGPSDSFFQRQRRRSRRRGLGLSVGGLRRRRR